MAGIFASAAAQGFVNVWTWTTDAPAIAQAAVLALWIFPALFFPFAWFTADRQARGLPYSYAFDIALVAVPLVVAPLYLWRSRSGISKLVALAGLVVIVVASLLVTVLASWAAVRVLGLPLLPSA